MHTFLERFDLRVSLGYGVVAILWVVLSDNVLAVVFAGNPPLLAAVDALKGLVFVVVTTLALFAVLRADLQKREHMERTLKNDIIERTQTLEALRQSESRFATLFQMSPAPTGISRLEDGHIVDVNDAFVKLLGYECAELFGHTALELGLWVYPQGRPDFVEAISEKGSVYNLELQGRTKSGAAISLLGSARMIDLGDVPYIVSLFYDITERKQMENQIRYQALLLANASDAVISTDMNFNVRTWNLAAERIYGWKAVEVMGKPIQEIIRGEYLDTTEEEALHQLQTAGTWRGETAHRCKDGSQVYLLASTSYVTDSTGNRVGVVSLNKDISERKRADQAQREGEARFHALVQNSTDVITILAADMTVLYESPSLEKVTGYKPEAVEGLRITDIIHPDDLPLIMERMTAILDRPAATFSVELRLRHADGSWRTQEATVTNLLDHPAIHGIVVNSRDITESRRSEEAFRESEGRYRSLFEHMLNGFAYCKMEFDQGRPQDFRYLEVNDAFETLTGLKQVIGKKVSEVIPGIQASDPELFASYGRVALTGQPETLEIYVASLAMWFSIAIYSPQKEYFVAVFEVITERKRAESALRQYNQRLGVLHSIDRGILTAQSPQSIAQMVAQGLTDIIHCDAIRIIAINAPDDPLPYLADYPPASQSSQDLLRQAIENYGLPESFHRGEPLLIDDVQTHTDFGAGFEEVLTRGNARAWIIVPLVAGEQLVGILAIGSFQPFAFTPDQVEIAREVADQLAIALHKHHLDEQIQAHAHTLEARVTERTEQLLVTKERSEAILMSASDAMMVASLDGSIEQVNTAFTKLFGYTLEQGRALPLFSLLDASSADTVRRTLDEIGAGGQTQRLELVGLRQDGTLFEAEAAFSRVEGGDATTLICSLRDITVRKRAEQDLRTALAKEKELNELKSRFVSMVAHDFRSPLASIQSSSDLLNNYSDRMTAEKKQHHFKTISGQIKFLTGILEDTLTISKAEAVGLSLHPLPTDLVPFCQSIIDDMQLIDKNRPIRFTVNGEVGTLEIDRDHLRRALVNLLSNAAKYSPEGSGIEFSLSGENEQVVIRIQDQGIGIPEDDQSHLFEVFHRAGNVGDIPGTGLGLVIVKRAVEAHGGSIAVESQVGLGTTFTVRLPLTAKTSSV